jgi:hypothetical protein
MGLKKYFLPLIAIGLLLFGQTAFAQDNELPKDFKSRLWYGGGLLLGFSGGGGISVFQFGLAPQVGYKITEPLSVGPRVSLVFTSYKQSGFKALGLFNTDVGAFVRYRVYKGFFIQGELSNEWYQDVDDFTGEKFSDTRFNQRIGGGYNFNGGRGGAGSEIGIMYNFAIANDTETWQNPLEYRFNFTFNF